MTSTSKRPKGAAAVVAAVALLSVPNGCYALSGLSPRRSFIQSSSAKIATLVSVTSACSIPPAASASAAPLPLQTASSGGSTPTTVRVEEVGGGFDLLSPPSSAIKSSDIFYPSSMTETRWKVQRVITSVEGDANQALVAWRSLGGGEERAFNDKLTEAYETKFVVAPDAIKGADYVYEGKTMRSAILDRSFEVSHRIAGDTVAKWDPTLAPNTLTYNRNDDEVELVVVQRKIEPPSETGFGSDELIRIKSSAGGAFKSLSVYRAARVRRRWRRGFDETTGKRVVDGLEIVTTYRVLDGVAGTEMPTSTAKSRIRMVEM